MNRHIIHILLILFLVVVPGVQSTHAAIRQGEDSLHLSHELQQARQLISQSDIDSARLILNRVSRDARTGAYWNLYFEAQVEMTQLLKDRDDLNEVIRNYLELIRELERTQKYDLLAEAYFALGQVYLDYELFKKATGYFLLSNDYYERSNNKKREIETLEILGELYIETENYRLAENYLLEAIERIAAEDPTKDISPLLKKLVLVYDRTGNDQKMLETNQRIFQISKEKSDLLEISNSLNDLGYNYTALGDHEKALKNFRDAYYSRSLLNQPDSKLATSLMNIGLAYHHLGKNDIAIDTLLSALTKWNRVRDYSRMAETNNIIARIYILIQDYKEAKFYGRNAIEAAEISGDPVLSREAYHTYSQIFQEENDFEEALAYYKKYLELDDSIRQMQLERQQQINQREFNAEKSEKELFLIIADREVKDLAMRQLKLESEASQKEIELLKRKQELERLEKERALQELKITQQELETAKKDREINELQQTREMQQLALAQKEAEEKEQQQRIELLEQRSQIREQELEGVSLRRKLSFITIALLSTILILIIIGYFQKRRDNKLLSKQKESMLRINSKLEEKNRQVAAQKNELERSVVEIENTLDKLKKAQKQLIESEKMASLGQITAGIAHEINNPINFVSSNVNPLKLNLSELREVLQAYQAAANEEGVDLGKLKEARELENKYDLSYLLEEVDLLLKGIAEGANRTKEIVLGLRNFSRVDQHDLRNTNIHEGIESTLVLLKNNYKKRIEIIRDYDENLDSIECYPGQLNQVFMNIINNAIQAVEGEGSIKIKTRKVKSRAVVWISDSGKGIPRDIKGKIFDPFFTTKDVGEGTGLGLSISYGIIQQHHGEIKVNSKPGKGTTFKIALPLHQTEPVA